MHLSPLDSVEDRERRRQYASRDDTEGKVLDERKAEVASSTLAPRQSRSRRRKSSFSAIFQHTTTSTPANVDKGMKLANGSATNMKTKIKTACPIPEIGLHAPARILVAVRAMVPVTLIPPNMAEATFATPCATTSIL
jgi:hypothetical protein